MDATGAGGGILNCDGAAGGVVDGAAGVVDSTATGILNCDGAGVGDGAGVEDVAVI